MMRHYKNYEESHRQATLMMNIPEVWTENDEFEVMYGELNEQEIILERPEVYTTKQIVEPRPAQQLA